MEADRLQAWFDGELEDDELTAAEVRWLEQAVNAAVVRKVLARPDVHIFPEHRSLQ